MAIKLKKLTKQQQEIVLSSGWVLLTAFVFLLSVYRQYTQLDYIYYGLIKSFCVIFVRVGTAFSVIVAGGLIGVTRRYLRTFPPRENIQHMKADDWKVEWIILVLILTAVLWSDGTPRGDAYVLWFGPMNSLYEILQYLITMIVLTGILYSAILLLIRRTMWKSWKETSIICRKIHNYKTRTPLEKQIASQYRWGKRLFLVFTAINLIFGAAICVQTMEYEFMLVFVMTTAVNLLIFLLCFHKNRTYKDIVKLTRQIDAMAEGKAIFQEDVLSENSLFALSAEKLGNIESAMKKSMEKQVQAERLKIDLVTNVSHDLKTPLTSMIGYADLLKKEELSAEARDYVDAISIKQEQLKDMIQDLFDLAKSTSQSEQLQMEPLDMKKLVCQIMADMEDAITKCKCTFRTTFPEEGALFLGDNRKMYRVVQNLLENTLKYSMDGTRVYVNVGKESGEVSLSIKNIASYEMMFSPEEIVERFNRGDESRTTEGHGLGLAIASSFTQNMGGTMKVELDGDLFKVTLRFPTTEEFEKMEEQE